MDSINLKNNVPPSASAEPNDKTSESSDFAEEFASASDKGTSPKSRSAPDRLETSLLYGSDSQNSENPTTSFRPDDFSLHAACSDGDVPLVQKLIDSRAVFNMKDESGNRPLHIACYKGHTEVVELLTINGASVNATRDCSETPLHIACYKGYTDIVKILLGNDANSTMTIHGLTPLHLACLKGHTDVV